MANSDLELPPGYSHPPDEGLELPPGYSAPAAAQGPGVGARAGNFVAQNALPLAGQITVGAAGMALGAPLGPVGMALGALGGGYIGGAAGRAVTDASNAAVNLFAPGTNPEKTPEQIYQGVNRAGQAGAIGEMGGRIFNQGLGPGPNLSLVGRAADALPPVAGQYLRAMTGTPEKYGENLVRNPSPVAAANPESAGVEYGADMGGLPGLGSVIQQRFGRGAPPTPGALDEFVREVYGKASDKLASQSLTAAEALQGRQAAVYLRDQLSSTAAGKAAVKYGGPILADGQRAFDQFLESSGVPIARASRNYFNAMTQDAFSSIFPLNRNMSANALRGTLAVGGALKGGYELTKPNPDYARAGEYLSAPFLFSPYANYLAVQGASALAPYMGALGNVAGRGAVQAYSESAPRNPAPPLAPR